MYIFIIAFFDFYYYGSINFIFSPTYFIDQWGKNEDNIICNGGFKKILQKSM